MKFRICLTSFCAAFALALGLHAQAGAEPVLDGRPRGGLTAFRQALLDASNDARVVVVATHPDDPYRALCMQLRRQWGCDVTVLLATRGEGGQNAVGPEQGLDLARIRTFETVRAAQELDVHLSFLGFADFGYSRSAAEALDVWRGERAYAQLRDRIRELGPDLVITIHGPEETHGQKKAVVDLLERLVFDAEAPAFGFFRAVGKTPPETPTVVIDYEKADLATGLSYRRESYRILGFHRTQAPRRPYEDAVLKKLALRERGRVHIGSLFGGLASIWDNGVHLERVLKEQGALYGAAALRKALDSLPQGQSAILGARAPAPIVAVFACLASMNAALRAKGLDPDLRLRLERRVQALERAARLGSLVSVDWVDPIARAHVVDDRVKLELVLRNGGPYEVTVASIGLADSVDPTLELKAAGGRLRLAPGAVGRSKIELIVPDESRLEPGGLDVAVVLSMLIRAPGLARPVAMRVTVARRILPPQVVTLRPVPEARFLVPENGGRVRLLLEIEKPAGMRLVANLAMAGPPGVRYLPESERDDLPVRISLDPGARRLRVPIQVVVPAWTKMPARPRELHFYLDGTACESAFCNVGVEAVKIRLPADLRIGLVRGPDTTIEESLASLGLDVRELEPRSLARANLEDYDTILIDSRALLRRRDDLVPQIPRFIDYARRGKHLVVLYHKPQEFEKNELGALLAPYSLELGTERVTREDAPVRMLVPDHPHLSWPNRIQARDWDGWVQERGLYFPAKYDSRYVELLAIRELSMIDGEGTSGAEKPDVFEPQLSSLLAAPIDRGSYVYCALVLHRQLRNLHPGAARLLVNLVTPPGWARLR